MTLAPLIAASLAIGLPARTKALWIDGLDVIKETGTPGNKAGTLLDTINVTEAGPGQVSSMTFLIDDPAGAIGIALAQHVLFWDITRDVPLFDGWVDAYEATPMGVGRQIRVDALGRETLLDWMKIPSITIASGADVYGAIASLVANATGVGVPIRVTGDNNTFSTLASPTALGGFPTTSYAITLTGVSLRQGIQSVLDSLTAVYEGTIFTGFYFTLDFYGNLRSWFINSSNLSAHTPTDYALMTISSASGKAPANLRHRTESGNGAHQVQVVGTGAGTGLVSDGTGLPGDVAVVRDSNSTTADGRIGIARSYLSTHGQTAGGTVELQEVINVGSVGAQNRAGGIVRITDAQTGLSAFDAAVTEISKTYYASGTEYWTISYGADLRSGAQLLRRLTRDQLS